MGFGMGIDLDMGMDLGLVWFGYWLMFGLVWVWLLVTDLGMVLGRV